MRVLLINPSTGFYIHPPTSPLGILSIATYLKSNGHEVRILDRTIRLYHVKKAVEDFKPDIVGFSLLSPMGLADAMKYSRRIMERGIPVFWGGHVATELPAVILGEKCADYCILSEGEETVLELCNTLAAGGDVSGIAGLCYMKNGAFVRNADRAFADLSRFPIDWGLIKPELYYQSYYCCKKMLYMYISKGCPFHCSFCFNSSFHRAQRRSRDMTQVLDEIEYLIKNHGLDGVYFCDELFCSTGEELNATCAMIKERRLPFVWGCEARINQYALEDIRTMYDAGCRWIMFGIESGSDAVLKRMHKGINRNMIEKTIEMCNSLGITVVGSFVIGYPGETEEDLRATCDLALHMDINLYSPNHFMPAPDSEISDQLIREGKMLPIRSLKEKVGVEAVEHIYDNFSAVPAKDLRTVRAFFLWVAFSMKNVASPDNSYALAKKAIVDALKNAFRYGPLMAVPRCLVAGGVFLTYAWNGNVNRSVMKKYGLSYKAKRQNNKALRARLRKEK